MGIPRSAAAACLLLAGVASINVQMAPDIMGDHDNSLRKAIGLKPNDPLDPAVWGGPGIRLYPEAAPGQQKSPKDIEYFSKDTSQSIVAQICAPHDDTVSLFKVSTPVLIPFVLPANHSGTDIAVMVIPGGGGEYIAWEKEGTDIAVWLNTIGINAFVLKYRVPNTPAHITGALEDAQRGISLIRNMAPEYKYDPKKVGTVGFSFGGNMALQLGVSLHRKYKEIDSADKHPWKPNFQMAIYAEGTGHLLLPNLGKIPPTFLATDVDDQCQPAGLIMMTATMLKQRGADVDLRVYGPGGRHGYGRCVLYTEFGNWAPVCEWPKRAAEFIMKHTGKRLERHHHN